MPVELKLEVVKGTKNTQNKENMDLLDIKKEQNCDSIRNSHAKNVM